MEDAEFSVGDAEIVAETDVLLPVEAAVLPVETDEVLVTAGVLPAETVVIPVVGAAL